MQHSLRYCAVLLHAVLLDAVLLHAQVALYTASVAADITTTRLTTGIDGFEDLMGLRVATWNDYVDDLRNLSVASTGYEWWVESTVMYE